MISPCRTPECRRSLEEESEERSQSWHRSRDNAGVKLDAVPELEGVVEHAICLAEEFGEENLFHD